MIVETFFLAVLTAAVILVALPVIAVSLASAFHWYDRRAHARHLARARSRIARHAWPSR